VKDRRTAPFCYQEHSAIEAIQLRFSGRQRTTALAIYNAMTYLASVRFKQGGRDGFVAGRAEIAETAGSKPATIDEYAAILEGELGLISRERRTDERGADLPSEWCLKSTPRVTEEAHGGSPSAPEEAPPSLTRARESAVDGRTRTSGPSSPSRANALDGSGPDDGGGERTEVPITFGAGNDRHATKDQRRAQALRVQPILADVAEMRGVEAPTLEAIEHTIASLPERHHMDAADALAHWALHGAGKRAPIRDLSSLYRGFVSNAPVVGGRRAA
jgi:hypothetical protein